MYNVLVHVFFLAWNYKYMTMYKYMYKYMHMCINGSLASHVQVYCYHFAIAAQEFTYTMYMYTMLLHVCHTGILKQV